MFHERTKHIEIDWHLVREKIQDGVVTPIHINSKDQLVDLLTKTLTKQNNHKLLQGYGLLDLSTNNIEEIGM